MQFFCHCGDCQAVNGGAYVRLAAFANGDVEVLQGETAVFILKSLPRERCTVCGTSLLGKPPGTDLSVIKAELLPPGMFEPQFHIHCKHALLPIIDDLPHFEGLPPIFGGSETRVGW
ncbi:MAG: GFA family protein [Gammaproteobacteria bacterium]